MITCVSVKIYIVRKCKSFDPYMERGIGLFSLRNPGRRENPEKTGPRLVFPHTEVDPNSHRWVGTKGGEDRERVKVRNRKKRRAKGGGRQLLLTQNRSVWNVVTVDVGHHHSLPPTLFGSWYESLLTKVESLLSTPVPGTTTSRKSSKD